MDQRFNDLSTWVFLADAYHEIVDQCWAIFAYVEHLIVDFMMFHILNDDPHLVHIIEWIMPNIHDFSYCHLIRAKYVVFHLGVSI